MDDRGLVNTTPFVAQELYLADEDGRDVLVVVVQATYALIPGRPLPLLEEQPPIQMAGTYNGEPGVSSYRYEPQAVPLKLATDVVLLGHAYAPQPGVPYVDVRFRVGPVGKLVRVFGDRRWIRSAGYAAITGPLPFEKIPLVYERAFGGWDRSADDPDQHTVEPRNPVGVGYHDRKHGAFVEGAPLPNLEDPRQLIRGYHDTPEPVGFGFVGPHWASRARYAGTYDEVWVQERMPLLPKDFDRRFYNAASPGLTASGFLRGDEPVQVVGAVPEGSWQGYLPGELPPQCTVRLTNRTTHAPDVWLDTVVIDTDAGHAVFVWRTHWIVAGAQIHDVRAIHVDPHPTSVHARTDEAVFPVN